jgi:hypothetical protein
MAKRLWSVLMKLQPFQVTIWNELQTNLCDTYINLDCENVYCLLVACCRLLVCSVLNFRDKGLMMHEWNVASSLG